MVSSFRCKWASFNTGIRNTEKHNIISEYDPLLDDKTPVLQPTPSFIAKSIQKIKDFGIWFLDYMPPKPKVVNEALESFKNLIKKLYNNRDTSFQLRESKSALKKFAIPYRVDGKDWIDPDLFLFNSKQPITNLMINTRQTEVKLILSCRMEKADLKSGEVIVKESVFHSKTEVNLESLNSSELFSKMKETVLESSAKFQRQGSNWRFPSLFSLDLHTISHLAVPLIFPSSVSSSKESDCQS